LSLRSRNRAIAPGIACVAVVVGWLVVCEPTAAAEFDGLFAGNNDFGNVGLLQTPTARMRADGEFGLGISTVRPYNQVHLFVQPLPWFETTVRYTDVTDRFYSNSRSFSGKQHYKDKSVDLKVRLLNEAHYLPSVALGVQDLGGTGLFSSEYLVSSYHYFDFDFSFGLAWGRLGSGGDIRNPFALIAKHFDTDVRFQDTSQGNFAGAGSTGLNRLFTGKHMGVFGGAEWITPIKGLALRVEYDANDYRHEALGNNLKQDSHVNFGLAYRGLPGLDMGVGMERGNMVMARLAIYTNFQRLSGVAKSADPAPPRIPPATQASIAAPADPGQREAAAAVPDAPAAAVGGSAASPAGGGVPIEQQRDFILELKQKLREQGYSFIAADFLDYEREVRVWISQDKYRNPALAVGRAARVLCLTAPHDISRFTLVLVDQGVENYRATVERADFEKAARGEADFDVGVAAVSLGGPGNGFGSAEYFDATRFPKFSWDMGPAVRQSVGGPDNFYFGQLYWKVSGGLELTDHLNLTAAAGFNIINNFNGIKLQSNSKLPHVRSDIVKYLQQGKNGLINLEADYIWSPHPDWYHRMSVGIFEEMYGGVASEVLYRPYGSHWAFAIDVNRVKKRGFDEALDFLPYTVTTGHATLYYKPGYYNLLFKLSGGQYLARDRGATIDVSREFKDGVRFGIFATKTNVSAAQFGEGSFDKGIYLTVPLDLFFAQSTRREAGFAYRPLTRDGGQMVYDGPELYFTVKDGQPSDFARGASELLN
jgi:hypothetical protein